MSYFAQLAYVASHFHFWKNWGKKKKKNSKKNFFWPILAIFWPFFGHFLAIFWPFCPAGRPGTEGFVPGHLLLPLSRDKRTPGQEKFFVPGQRDNVPSRGNPSFLPFFNSDASNWDSTTSFATIRARQVEIKAITLDGYIDTQDHYYTTSEQYRTINVMRDSGACLCKVKFPIYTKRTSECWRKGRRGPLKQPNVS